MDRYIEVIGEGSYVETACRFIAEVSLEVRAAKDETAFAEVSELARKAATILGEAGIEESEMVEGGSGGSTAVVLEEKGNRPNRDPQTNSQGD
jgi:hypothetical protein